MKKIILFYFLSVLIIFCSSSSASEKLSETENAGQYNHAGELYNNGNFIEALRAYETLISKGIKDADLYYNASNAAYKNGSTGKAILYLERSLKLSPSDKDEISNLNFLNSIKTDKEPPENNVVSAYISQKYNRISVNGAALWSGISFALALLLISAALFIGGIKKTVSISLSSLFFIIFLLSTGVLIQKIHHAKSSSDTIIMVPEVNAYSGPGTENTHIFTLHEGTKVTIERTQDNWNLIRLKSGAGGWINADTMEKI